jgi:site-specific DNA recombinase
VLRRDLPFDGYIRVSRVGDRGERLRSPDWQRREIRDAANARGLTVRQVISDLDESGGSDQRPGLLRIIRRIEQGKSAGIVVAKLDRFSRDLEQSLRLARRIEEAGGQIISFAEPNDRTTPEGVLQVNFLMAVAQHQRDVAKRNFAKARAGAVATGIWPAPLVPVGYRLRGSKDRRLVPDERLAPIVASAFDLAAAGVGPSSVGDYLASQGAATAMGSKTWSKQAVAYLLANRVYIGEVRSGDFINTDAHQPIVDRATFEAAQRPRRQLGRARGTYLLSGLARCFNCRHALQGTVSSRGRRRYRCTRRHAGGLCPDPVSCNADELEAIIEREFFGLVRRLELAGDAIDAATDLSALETTLAKAERDLEAWRDDSDTQEILGRDGWLDGLRVRQQRVGQARTELADARTAEAGTVEFPPVAELRGLWAQMAVEDRREHLQAVIDVVALRRPPSGGSLDDGIVIWPAGAGPELPRRGFHRRPVLRAFDGPDGAGVATR